MQRLDGRLIVSAHDLVGFLGCEHLTVLDLEVAEEKRGRSPSTPRTRSSKLLQKRGFEHETRCLERLEAEGRTVREIQKAGFSLDVAREGRDERRSPRCARASPSSTRAPCSGTAAGGATPTSS